MFTLSVEIFLGNDGLTGRYWRFKLVVDVLL